MGLFGNRKEFKAKAEEYTKLANKEAKSAREEAKKAAAYKKSLKSEAMTRLLTGTCSGSTIRTVASMRPTRATCVRALNFSASVGSESSLANPGLRHLTRLGAA